MQSNSNHRKKSIWCVIVHIFDTAVPLAPPPPPPPHNLTNLVTCLTLSTQWIIQVTPGKTSHQLISYTWVWSAVHGMLIMFEENSELRQNEVEWTREVETRQNILSVGEALKAVFWSIPGINHGTVAQYLHEPTYPSPATVKGSSCPTLWITLLRFMYKWLWLFGCSYGCDMASPQELFPFHAHHFPWTSKG